MALTSTVRRVTVEELPEHLPTLEQELSDGQSIELIRGEVIIAELTAKRGAQVFQERSERPMPDFMGRMKAIFGEKPMDTDITAFVREDRDARG